MKKNAFILILVLLFNVTAWSDNYKFTVTTTEGAVLYCVGDNDGNVTIVGLKSSGNVITIPSTVSIVYLGSNWIKTGHENNVISIGRGAFLNCNNPTKIIIPNSVTTIESSAFSSCNNLANITIPNSVTSIGESAFWGCI